VSASGDVPRAATSNGIAVADHTASPAHGAGIFDGGDEEEDGDYVQDPRSGSSSESSEDDADGDGDGGRSADRSVVDVVVRRSSRTPSVARRMSRTPSVGVATRRSSRTPSVAAVVRRSSRTPSVARRTSRTPSVAPVVPNVGKGKGKAVGLPPVDEDDEEEDEDFVPDLSSSSSSEDEGDSEHDSEDGSHSVEDPGGSAKRATPTTTPGLADTSAPPSSAPGGEALGYMCKWAELGEPPCEAVLPSNEALDAHFYAVHHPKEG